MEAEGPESIVYGFGEFVGRFLSFLEENKLKVICAIVVDHPEGVHWSKLKNRTRLADSSLDYHLDMLIRNGFLEKDDLKNYYVTDLGHYAFDISVNLARFLAKLESPPQYMDEDEFHRLKDLTEQMIRFLINIGYQLTYFEVVRPEIERLERLRARAIRPYSVHI